MLDSESSNAKRAAIRSAVGGHHGDRIDDAFTLIPIRANVTGLIHPTDPTDFRASLSEKARNRTVISGPSDSISQFLEHFTSFLFFFRGITSRHYKPDLWGKICVPCPRLERCVFSWKHSLGLHAGAGGSSSKLFKLNPELFQIQPRMYWTFSVRNVSKAFCIRFWGKCGARRYELWAPINKPNRPDK